jgi:Na+/melibiose symporter-like transporter
MAVFAILRAGTWGFVQPKPGAPEWLGLSPSIWLILAGAATLALFATWENRRATRGQAVLVDLSMLGNLQLRAGVISFLFMFLVLAGTFFAVPLYLSIALGISAIETGVRLLPLSLSLFAFATLVPRLRPTASPRRVVRMGFTLAFGGLVLLVALLDASAGAEIITWPMLLTGAGLGMMASQLGAVTVGAVPDEQSGEVGGLQNTGSQLGSSIGTALAGALLVSALTASFFTGVQSNPDVPESVVAEAQTQLAGGVPFISDEDLESSLADADVPTETADAIVSANEESRIDGLRVAIAALALLALLGIAFTGNLPTKQPEPDAAPA